MMSLQVAPRSTWSREAPLPCESHDTSEPRTSTDAFSSKSEGARVDQVANGRRTYGNWNCQIRTQYMVQEELSFTSYNLLWLQQSGHSQMNVLDHKDFFQVVAPFRSHHILPSRSAVSRRALPLHVPRSALCRRLLKDLEISRSRTMIEGWQHFILGSSCLALTSMSCFNKLF